MKLLELFCGRGGWSKSFHSRGWECVGVDLVDLGYPFRLILADCRTLDPDWINGFDAVIASPPCEDFARAWLPWLRGDHKPKPEAIDLLRWSVALLDRPRRLVECSNFAAKHVAGSIREGSFALWGDVPLLMPATARRKTKKSGLRPDLRAEIPVPLADIVADHFSSEAAQ